MITQEQYNALKPFERNIREKALTNDEFRRLTDLYKEIWGEPLWVFQNCDSCFTKMERLIFPELRRFEEEQNKTEPEPASLHPEEHEPQPGPEIEELKTEDIADSIKHMHASGLTQASIAEHLGISRAKVQRILAKKEK